MPRGNYSIFIPLQGCPYHCIYCDQHKISGEDDMCPAKASFLLQRDMPLWNKRGMRGQIAFFGGTFTGLPRETMISYLEMAKPYVDNGMAEGIRISTRPDRIDDDILKLLKEYNVTHIELGVQSLDDTVLRASGRGYSSDIIALSADRILKAGFTLGMQMMPGLPEDTWQKSIVTARRIIELGAMESRIYPTVVIKNTPLATLYEAGEYHPLALSEAVELTAVLKDLFEKAGVTVLKVGLHSGTIEKDIVAGPFHPSFGQLVNSKLCLDKMIAFCKQMAIHDTDLYVYPKHYDISDIVAQHRYNARYLKEKYGISLKFSKNVLTNSDKFIIL